MEINDTQFASLVLLIVADRLGVTAVREWEAVFGPGRVAIERRYLSDPNDAAMCALRIAEQVVRHGEAGEAA